MGENGTSISHSILMVQGPLQKMGRKSIWVTVWGWLKQNSVFRTWQDCWISNSQQLFACTRPPQNQASWNSNITVTEFTSGSPNWRAVGSLWLLKEGDSVFHKDVTAIRSTSFQWNDLHLYGEHSLWLVDY